MRKQPVSVVVHNLIIIYRDLNICIYTYVLIHT